MNKKRFIAVIAAVCMMLVLAGCQSQDTNADVSADESANTQEETETNDSADTADTVDGDDLLAESGELCTITDADRFGKVGDVFLTDETNNLADTFGALGYEIVEDQRTGESRDMFYAERPASGGYERMEITLFPVGKTQVTAETIESEGFGQYWIDAKGYPYSEYAEYYPAITWAGGITWGSTPQEIKDVYGIPTAVSEYGYIAYSYSFPEHDGTQTEMRFVCKPEEGLQEVEMNIYYGL